MRKIICLSLSVILLVLCCACGNTNATVEDETIVSTTEPVVVPTVKMVVNASEDDTTTSIRVFPVSDDRDDVYVHYYIESQKPEEMIRIKVEDRWGMDEMPKEDFKVDSDKIIAVETNKWHSRRISCSASNLYFYRVTLYYGEQNEVLGTATIYTPYETPVYDEEDFNDDAPAFHHIEELTTEEQAFFDLCNGLVADYAKNNGFTKVNSIKAWQGEDAMYLYVEYKGGGYKTVWFSISNENPNSWRASEDVDVIVPDGEGTASQAVLEDYYYVEQALSKAMEG